MAGLRRDRAACIFRGENSRVVLVTEPVALAAGTPLKHGTFVIETLLGRGGFGEVYRARQPSMDRDVAIKVLTPALAADSSALARFKREALAAGAISHPNVLPVYDFDYDEPAGVWFLAMQYVPGGRTLNDLLGAPLPSTQAAGILTQIASALDVAHARGMVHRDVKPPNVLLDGDRALLTDFGIAHLVQATAITASGLLIGTPLYMAPEQWLSREVGPRSDQYALAVMAYQLLVGRPPFTGDHFSLAHQHVSAPPPAPTGLAPGVPPAAGTALLRALNKDPADRFPHCQAFAQALHEALAPGNSETTSVTADQRGEQATPAVARTPVPRATVPVVGLLLVVLGSLALTRLVPSELQRASSTSAQRPQSVANGGAATPPRMLFASRLDARGAALNAGTRFPTSVPEIYAVFDPAALPPGLRVVGGTEPQPGTYYAYLQPIDMPVGSTLSWQWFAGGDELMRFRHAENIGGDRPPGYHVWLGYRFGRGGQLPPGEYEVVVRVDGDELARATITLTPGERGP